MRRILPLLGIIILLAMPLAAQDNETEEDKEFTYRMNGRGDQYLKIGIMPEFPLNFNGQLYVGGAAQIGYYRYLNSWLAVGGDLMAGYHPTLGSNVFMFVPITFGVSFLPTVWRFEFPITLTAGFAFESYQNKKYFPGFAAKAEAGMFYRFSESWSFGIGSDLLYLPQWYSSDYGWDKPDYGLFITASASVRYHF